jgi:hypothetical protein
MKMREYQRFNLTQCGTDSSSRIHPAATTHRRKATLFVLGPCQKARRIGGLQWSRVRW